MCIAWGPLPNRKPDLSHCAGFAQVDLDPLRREGTLLEADEFLFDTLSPNNWEDPCSSVIELETKNISQNKLVRFSRELPESPARFAVDGGELEW